MENLKEILFETADLLLQSVDKLPKYDDKTTGRVVELIDDGAKKIKAELYDEAIACFEAAIRLSPRSFGAYLSMIRGFREKGKDLEALSWGGFTLALADTSQKRTLVYLLMGSAALDTFKLSLAIEHANQSLGFYQIALEEDPTELRAIWNSIETHVEVVCVDSMDDITHMKHRRFIENKLTYLNDQFTRSDNPTLATAFVVDGEKIQERLREKKISIHEFDEGCNKLRSHAGGSDEIHHMSRELESKSGHVGLRKKVLIYVIASAMLAGGGFFATIVGAEGAEKTTGAIQQIESSRDERIGGNPNIDRVFAPGPDDQLEVVVVDPTWDEMKQLATVEPSWDEFKALA